MGADLVSACAAHDAGISLLLRRDGKEKECFKYFDAVFHHPVCFKHRVGVVRLQFIICSGRRVLSAWTTA